MLTPSWRPLAVGPAMSAAIAIRPNLAPLAAALIAWSAVNDVRGSVRLAVGAAVGVIGIAVLNGRIDESALTSGYGRTSDLYAIGFFATNSRQVAAWIAEVDTPVVALSGLFFARFIAAHTGPDV